jgi:TetR/AcrR family transcriptional regulator
MSGYAVHVTSKGASGRADDSPPSPRRTPRPDERQRDADRTRQQIVDAARAEFADHGFAGARVGDIADRAGVNKQLISYYFGGKEGLYQAILEQWREVEARHRRGVETLDELVVAYLRANHEQPELARILIWEALARASDRTVASVETAADDTAEMAARQAAGQLAADLLPGHVLLALMGAVAAPTILPHIAGQLTGLDPAGEEFLATYAAQLGNIVRRLAQ